MKLTFEWDPVKAQSTFIKHGVSFETARLVFANPFADVVRDRIEGGEQKWRAIGAAENVALLVVAHTIRDEEGWEIIRIISARHATRSEKRPYEQNRRGRAALGEDEGWRRRNACERDFARGDAAGGKVTRDPSRDPDITLPVL